MIAASTYQQSQLALLALARRVGVPDADAEDAVQDFAIGADPFLAGPELFASAQDFFRRRRWRVVKTAQRHPVYPMERFEALHLRVLERDEAGRQHALRVLRQMVIQSKAG